MVLIAEKQLEQAVSFDNAKSVTILGIDQGCFLLYSATISTISRNTPSEKTIIVSVHLTTKEQKILYRYSSSAKITHASINSNRSLCCFVTKTEPTNFDVFVAEIGQGSPGRLFSLKYSRPSPIRAYLTAHDVVLLFYRDEITVFRMPNASNTMERSMPVDRAAKLDDCIYYQWDTLVQRLHVVQRRTTEVSTSPPTNNGGNRSVYIYTNYNISARGQFESIMTIDFDLQISVSSLSYSNFEILSNDTSIFLCWQSTIKEETAQAQYGVVSLGHGRSIYITKQLNRENMELFQSRKVHFGLVAGDYMFAFLRGEFIHLLDLNIHSKFVNHMFLPDQTRNLPYDTRYTTQRGLMDKTLTLIYEKKNLFTYTIRVNPDELIQNLTSTMIHPIIAYSILASKDNYMLGKILEQILKEMYDGFDTKAYLKELLTALIFHRLSKKIYNPKYLLVFPSTTVTDRHIKDGKFSYVSVTHHRHYAPEHGRITTIDKDYWEKLRQSFELYRKYREKLPFCHEIVEPIDENIRDLGVDDDLPSPKRRQTLSTPPPSASPASKSQSSGGFFSFFKHDSPTKSIDLGDAVKEKSLASLHPRNRALYTSVSDGLRKLHRSWDGTRIHELALEYVQATQKQCNYLIELFTHLAGFNRTQALTDIDPQLTAKTYGPLLMIMEKLYLAIIELGLSPTDELHRALLEISFRVMPFDEFIKAIDHNILILTEEFVTRVVLELDDQPKSYAMKEQLIFMLPTIDSEVHCRLFGLMKDDRGKRTAAQLLIARRFSSDTRRTGSSESYGISMMDDMSEMMNVNDGLNTHSRLIEQAAVTFFRDCNQRGIFGEDEMIVVKNGLLALASSTAS